MLTHEQIWQAIDRLAQSFGYSTSGLAKQAGLDSTSFNKSKRTSPEGKPRWPSTESVSRILKATGATMYDFISLVDELNPAKNASALTIPVLGLTQASTQNCFDEGGHPTGDGWDEMRFPDYNANNSDGFYALEINGDEMHPLYRDGDVIVVSPKAKLRTGDRIVLKTTNGEIMATELRKQNASRIEVRSLNADNQDKQIAAGDIAWMGRIVWASQ